MIYSYIDQCFQKSGILASHPGFSYRPAQHKFALELAQYIDDAEAGKHRFPNASKPPMLESEVGTGVGKTLAYALVLAFAARVYEHRRCIISTYSRALREDLVNLKGIVDHCLNQIHLPPIAIEIVRSSSEIASLEYAEHIVVGYQKNSPYYQDAVNYRDAILNAESMGDVYLVSDWLDAGNSFDFFSVGRGGSKSDKIGINLTISYEDFKKYAHEGKQQHNKSGYKKYLDGIESSKTADIMVMTHTMFVINGIHLGKILKTNNEGESFHVLIDEADQFGHQATTVYNSAISLDLITSLLRHAKKRVTGKAPIAKLRKFLKDTRVAKAKHIFKNQSEQEEIAGLIGEVVKDLVAAYENSKTPMRGTIEYDYATNVVARLKTIEEWITNRTVNTFEQRATEDAGLNLASVFRQNDELLVLEAGTGYKIVNRSWRNYNVHSFASFTMVSGTILDHRRSSEPFRMLLGISKNDNPLQGNPIRTTGRIDELIFCPVDTMTTIWSSTATADAISENTAGSVKITSDEFREHSSSIIMSAMAEEPCLILVNSYRDIEDYESSLAGAKQRVIFQQRGERSIDFIRRLCADRGEHGVFPSAVCLYWSGANFVYKGSAIYRYLVIPRMPRKPFAETGALGKELQKAVETFWTIRQGIGRLFRSPIDPDGVVWFLDPRYKAENDFVRKLPPMVKWGTMSCDGVFDRVLRSAADGAYTKISVWENGARAYTVNAAHTYQ